MHSNRNINRLPVIKRSTSITQICQWQAFKKRHQCIKRNLREIGDLSNTVD